VRPRLTERSERKSLAELIPIATRKFRINFRSVLLSGLIRTYHLASLRSLSDVLSKGGKYYVFKGLIGS